MSLYTLGLLLTTHRLNFWKTTSPSSAMNIRAPRLGQSSWCLDFGMFLCSYVIESSTDVKDSRQPKIGKLDLLLNTVVCPKEPRAFFEKLSASGWDIDKAKHQATTIFGGTWDTHLLLPLATKLLDRPHQRHTNALVLHHLLQPFN